MHIQIPCSCQTVHVEVRLLREDGACELIRRAETPADYFATLDVTPTGRQLLNSLKNNS